MTEGKTLGDLSLEEKEALIDVFFGSLEADKVYKETGVAEDFLTEVDGHDAGLSDGQREKVRAAFQEFVGTHIGTIARIYGYT